MPNAKDVTVNTEFLKVLSVGESGSGKSTFAASFPTPGFIFDFGSEIISYKGRDFDYEQYELSGVGWAKFERDLPTIKKACAEGKYKTIIVDNVSAMTDVCMEKAMQLDPKRSLTNGPLWNVHYGMVKNLMEGRLHQLLNFNANLVLIAHLEFLRDEAGAIVGAEPKFTGSLSADIPAYFHEVYYHSTRKEGTEIKWVIQTVPIAWNKGRSRSSGKERLLPDFLPNDYNEIMAYLKGTKVKSTTKQPATTNN